MMYVKFLVNIFVDIFYFIEILLMSLVSFIIALPILILLGTAYLGFCISEFLKIIIFGR